MKRVKSKTSNRKKKADENSPCSVAMPAALQQAIILRAESEDRSFSSIVRLALGQYLKK